MLNCNPTTINTDTGGTALICQAISSGDTASQTITIKRDVTAPTANLAVTAGIPGNNGWYTSDVTVATMGTDALSGIATCSAVQTVNADSVDTSLVGNCTDNAGNSSNAAPLSIKRDTTPPTASLAVTAGTLGDNGWYVSDVTAATSGAGALSGIASCSPDLTIDSDTTEASLAGSCTDNAGNNGNAAPLAVKRDATPPTLTPVVTPNPVSLNGIAVANANAADTVSGVASASCGALATNTAGDRSVPCTATDLAGNAASAAANYTVSPAPADLASVADKPIGFAAGGFSVTVANPPQLNRVKAGDRMPFI